MILKAEEIAKLLREQTDDPFVITPEPDLKDLEESGSASVDLRLGRWFVTLRQCRMSCIEVTSEHEDEGTLSLKQRPEIAKTHFVAFGESYYLHPRAFVLGTTLEWIRVPTNYAAYVTGRSTWGRRGLIIATATGVHPGFTGCLTLEITNVGEIPIELKPGMSICQMFLHLVQATSHHTDRSVFLGKRRPGLGRLAPDRIARALAAPGEG